MQSDVKNTDASTLPDAARLWVWTAIVIGSSILFSMAFACATPFAALAAVAGTKMLRRDALILVMFTWLTNQMIGYFILGYPRTWDSFAWGAAIGIAAALATLWACESTRWTGAAVKSAAIAFIGAFIVYEGALYAAAFILPSSDAAFSLPIITRIFEINAVAFIGLLILQRLATAFGLLVPRDSVVFVEHRA